MNLSQICKETCISLDVPDKSKPEILRYMAKLAAHSGKIESVDLLVESLQVREEIKTTGIGLGVAIPHGTAEGVDGLVLALGISKKGIEFDSLDEKPVHLIFLLAGELQLQTSFLSILSKISRLFRDQSFRQDVIAASDAQEILALIQSKEDH